MTISEKICRSYNKGVLKKGLLIILILYVSGCSGASAVRYVNPDANFSYIRKIAILPFNNMSGDKFAGEKIRDTLSIEVMSRQVFDVVEQGEVRKALNAILPETGAEAGMTVEVDNEMLKLIGEKLGVQAVMLGSVDDYSGGSYGKGGAVSISLRMLDTSSGIVLWQSKVSVQGQSMWRKLMGFDEVGTAKLTLKAIRIALSTLF